MFKIKRKQQPSPQVDQPRPITGRPVPQGEGDRIMIAVPHMGLVVYEWARALRDLRSPVPYGIVDIRLKPTDWARNWLVNEVKKSQSSHILFLDSDTMMPWDGLAKLYMRHVPIITGIVGAKNSSCGETAAVYVRNKEQTGFHPVQRKTFEEAGDSVMRHPDGFLIGMAATLISMDVFKQIEEPYFLTQKEGAGEDFYFCEKAHKAGIPICVDPTVRCEHIDFSVLDFGGRRGPLKPRHPLGQK